MADEYTGPYATGESFAKVTRKQPEQMVGSLVCPECKKKCKSSSGFTLHLQRCCPDRLDCDYQDRMPHQPKDVWQLDLDNFHDDLKSIDPKAYFITSGEAVIKTEKLYEDLERAFHAAKELHHILKTLRGGAKYLETQWDMNRLLLKKKNPRPSSRNSMRKAKHDDQ